jgi:hypothetical protein
MSEDDHGNREMVVRATFFSFCVESFTLPSENPKRLSLSSFQNRHSMAKKYSDRINMLNSKLSCSFSSRGDGAEPSFSFRRQS